MTDQGNSEREVTPYELATLASRICYPGQCINDPKGAIAAARRLLIEARYACAHAKAEEREHKEDCEAYEKELETRIDWVYAIKKITGERRRDRATKRFEQFMAREAPPSAKAKFSHYKRDGFTIEEAMELEDDFSAWKQQPKRKKGRQGHRKSEFDRRLRTELVGLVPTEPRKRY